MTIQFFQLKEGQVLPLDESYPGNLDYQFRFIPDRLKSVCPINVSTNVLYDWSATASATGQHTINGNLDFEVINNHPLIEYVLIPYAETALPDDNEYFKSIKEKLTKPYIILHSNTNDINGHSVFYPFWVNFYPREFSVRIPTVAEVENSSRDYRYSSLTHNVSYERLLNLLYGVKYQTLIDSIGIVTFPYCDVTEYEKELLKFWPEGRAILDEVKFNLPFNKQNISDPTQFDNQFEVKNTAFLNSYMNVIMESGNIITERTLKPILAGQLFVTPTPGVLELLTKLGFDTFDDIIQHDRYTEYTEYADRIQAIHKLMSRWKNENWKDIFEKTKQRRLNNRNLLLSDSIGSGIHADLVHKISF